MGDTSEKIIGDIYLAAAFLSYDVPLTKIDRSDNHRQKFYFCGVPKRIFIVEDGMVMVMENPTLDDIEDRFIAKTLMFPPSFPDAVRRIKSSLHS